ncbi:MAG: hypothetical protein M1347_07665 [Chloroflexi bacterium]|nr:hypothetical protein [Chloroflexota bacterium]
MLKKVFMGLGAVMVMVFATVMPAFASIPAEEVKVEGIVQSIDFVARTFTLLTEDGTEFTVDAPDGFDLALLTLGAKVEAQGSSNFDTVISASEIELQDGTEFEVEDETEDVGDDDSGEVEDESQDDVDDDDQDEVDEDHDDDSDDDEDRSGSNSGSDHEDDSHDGEDD